MTFRKTQSAHKLRYQTLVSQTNYFVLVDPSKFPDPQTFDPERWTRAAAKGERLDRYLVNFSKGSRICLGMKYVDSSPTFLTSSWDHLD